MSFKKISAVLIALGFTSVVNAAGFAPREPAPVGVPVTIPDNRSGWSLDGAVFWAQPTHDDLYFAYQTKTGGTLTEMNFHVIDTAFHFAFEIGADWLFSSGNDISINWTRFHHGDSDHIHTTTTPYFEMAQSATAWQEIRSHVNFNYDALNFEFSQMVDVGHHANLRGHAGFQYAQLDTNHWTKGWMTAAQSTFDLTDAFNEFHGFGPRAGFDGHYELGNGFALVSRWAVALLVGDLEFHSSVYDVNGGNMAAKTNYYVEDERTIVPTVDAKNGVSYTHSFNDGSLTLEGGWRWLALFHVIKHAHPTATNSNEASNFGIHGPYVALHYRAV